MRKSKIDIPDFDRNARRVERLRVEARALA
jgi:hypothetical protein